MDRLLYIIANFGSQLWPVGQQLHFHARQRALGHVSAHEESLHQLYYFNNELSMGSHPFHINVLTQTVQSLDIFFIFNIFIIDSSPSV